MMNLEELQELAQDLEDGCRANFETGDYRFSDDEIDLFRSLLASRIGAMIAEAALDKELSE